MLVSRKASFDGCDSASPNAKAARGPLSNAFKQHNLIFFLAPQTTRSA